MVNQGPCTRLEEDILGTTLWLLGRIAIWCHLDKQEKKITVFFYFANLWNLHNFSSFPDFVNIYSSLYCVLETISPSAMKFSCPPSDNLPKKKKDWKEHCSPPVPALSCHTVMSLSFQPKACYFNWNPPIALPQLLQLPVNLSWTVKQGYMPKWTWGMSERALNHNFPNPKPVKKLLQKELQQTKVQLPFQHLTGL